MFARGYSPERFQNIRKHLPCKLFFAVWPEKNGKNRENGGPGANFN
jgi:hypothetical protein